MQICLKCKAVFLRSRAVLVLLGVFGLLNPILTPLHADVLSDYRKLSSSAHLVVDKQGNVLSSLRADEAFIPASTVKLVTAWLSLAHWGEQHRFQTGFYYDAVAGVLWVKAGGDPFLVSEELEIIAKKIYSAGIKNVSAIGIQADLYSPDLVVPGATTTDNPYDAVPTSLAANFNTVHIQVDGNVVSSAESQTPLTMLSRQIGAGIEGQGKYRVNIGPSSITAETHFAELLAEILKKHGVAVGSNIKRGAVPAIEPLYVHNNTRTLGEIVEGMLRYSTNFIANQLMLTLVAEHTGKPANFKQVENYIASQLKKDPGWDDFTLQEGAGLSPENQLTAAQLVQLLGKFRRWQHLLPEIKPGLLAKTGTLAGVKTLAGYIKNDAGDYLPFAVLINQPVDALLPSKVIEALVD